MNFLRYFSGTILLFSDYIYWNFLEFFVLLTLEPVWNWQLSVQYLLLFLDALFMFLTAHKQRTHRTQTHTTHTSDCFHSVFRHIYLCCTAIYHNGKNMFFCVNSNCLDFLSTSSQKLGTRRRLGLCRTRTQISLDVC